MLHPLEQFVARCVAEQALRLAHGVGGLGQKRLKNGLEGRVELSRRRAVTDQAGRLGLIDAERLSQQKVARSQPPPDQPRQKHRACRLRNQPQVDERQ